MHWSLYLLALVISTITYYVGYFWLAILLRVGNGHYFIGFGKGFFDVTFHGTRFTIGLFIPIYGLARIYKVENATKKRPDLAWTFHGKPLLHRLAVTYGGAFSLLLTGILCFIVYTYTGKHTFISKDEVNKYGIYPSKLATEHGFQPGDKILTINGKDYSRFDELLDRNNFKDSESTIQILRNNQTIDLIIPPINYRELNNRMYLEIYAPFEIDSIHPGSLAAEIGLLRGDRIVSVNGKPIVKLYEMQEAFDQDEDGTVTLAIHRQQAGDSTFTVVTTLNDNKRIGVYTREVTQYSNLEYSLGQAFIIGTKRAFQNIYYEIQAHLNIYSGKRLTGGPIQISTLNKVAWEFIWYFMGSWLVWFAFWNILPYPKSALWEAIALAYEGITRKNYSYSAFSTSLTLGWVVFVGLMMWGLVRDIVKLF